MASHHGQSAWLVGGHGGGEVSYWFGTRALAGQGDGEARLQCHLDASAAARVHERRRTWSPGVMRASHDGSLLSYEAPVLGGDPASPGSVHVPQFFGFNQLTEFNACPPPL